MMRTNAIKTARVSAFMTTRPKLKPALATQLPGTEASGQFRLLLGEFRICRQPDTIVCEGWDAYRNVRKSYPLVEVTYQR
jgi:hypothetical protein